MSEGRSELKYALPPQARRAVLQEASPFVQPDPNAEALDVWLPRLRPVSGLRATGYRVSSLYLDDPQLDGYGKRMADLPIRNRVRIRTYGEVGQLAPVFLEAKRKLYGRVVKARMRVCDTAGWAELGAPAPWRDLHARVTPALRRPVARWVKTVEDAGMASQCRVEYLRETYVDGSSRFTLDHEVRAAATGDAHALRGPCPTALLPPGWFVLELKFNGAMPAWMRGLTRRLHLTPEPVSKFALGMAHTVRCNAADVRRFTPPSVRRAPSALVAR